MQDRRRFLLLSMLTAIMVILLVIAMTQSDARPWLMASIVLGLVMLILALQGNRNHAPSVVPRTLQAHSGRNHYLETLSSALSLPFMIVNASGRIVFMSKALSAKFPYLEVQAHFSTFSRSVSFVDAMNAALAGQKVHPFAIETHRGGERVFEIVISDISDSNISSFDGELLVEIFDRTEERQSDLMRRNFIANASHELRTPLASILGGLETLRENPNKETIDHFMPIMTREAERMKRLIDDLMSLSRVEMNEHYPPEKTVNLNAVLKDSLNAFEASTDMSGVVIDNQFRGKANIRGDRDQLEQVILNILDNAVKYSGGEVEITISRIDNDPTRPRFIGLRIMDNGPGIATVDLPHLTERFYRVSKTESRNKGGTGLGLAIVKHMVRRHQGELQIQSRIGEGSAFTIWLPTQEN